MMKKSSIVIILLSCLVVLLGGYIVYDKVINKESGVTETDSTLVNCQKCQECENNCPNSRCDCPSCSCNGVKINSLKEIKFNITDKNQTIKVGNKEVKIRKVNDDLYINDLHRYNDVGNPDKAYVTDQFILFTNPGQCQEAIDFVVDENGDNIVVSSSYQIYDLQSKNGYLYAKGMSCSGEPYPIYDVIIKYIDHTLIVTKVK